MSDIEIEIDGKKCQAKPNQMVIQVADEAGIYIPRFCYHKNLSVAANCRMCLVEVEKAPKTLPACATPVMPGMKVFTKSAKAIASQKAVMEFLLINHPLDCPICDQGGECELQDLAMGFGASDSKYVEGKRAVKDQDLGPLIETEMTRCIQCTRCVRFGDEVAGLRELGATRRGENLEIRAYLDCAMTSEVSGNVIDLCPVGALTSKPFRFKARAWELDQHASIAAHDCLGSNINVHSRYGKVFRVVPRDNEVVNQCWISDRDRFSYESLHHADRLIHPRIRVDGEFKVVDWQEALEFAVMNMQYVLVKAGSEHFGALAHPSSTLEELYLLQKLVRQLGSHNIDHRLRQTDFSDQNDFPLYPGMDFALADIENCDAILLVGSHLQREQPIAALRVRKAFLKNTQVFAINPIDFRFPFELKNKKIIAPHEMVFELASVAKALHGIAGQPVPAFLSEVSVDEVHQDIAKNLFEKKNACLLLGAIAFNHPEAAIIRKLSQLIAKLSSAKIALLTEGANTAGAWLAGAVPHRSAGGHAVMKAGLNAATMFSQPRKVYLLLNIEPDLDCQNFSATVQALAQADFVVAISVFKNSVLEKYADVILPLSAFTETSGTFVNASGAWQSFKGAAYPHDDARPGWKILRVLGNLFQLNGFEYLSSDEIREEIQAIVSQSASFCASEKTFSPITKSAVKLSRIGEIPMYAADGLVRRSKPLQEMQTLVEGDLASIRLHPQTAHALKLQEGMKINVKQKQSPVQLSVRLDERIAHNAAYIAGAIEETCGLEELFGEIEIMLGKE